jgi:hypothetical protein
VAWIRVICGPKDAPVWERSCHHTQVEMVELQPVEYGGKLTGSWDVRLALTNGNRVELGRKASKKLADEFRDQICDALDSPNGKPLVVYYP